LGRSKVSKKFYYVSTWLVWCGSLLSALWIIIANSWMQTPAGYVLSGPKGAQKAVLTNFFAAGFNPSTLPRYAHVIDAVLITGGFMAAAIGAYHLLKGVHKEFGRAAVSIGLVIATIFSVLMLLTGHFQAVEVANNQPVKMAAMEGMWNAGPMPLGLGGLVDVAGKKTTAIEIPGGVSFLDSGTFTKPFKGLNDFAPTDLPPIQATYQTYHLMIIVFVLLVAVSLVFWWMNRTGKLENSPGALKALMWLWLLPELGIQMGWMAAEIGRQPWIVQGLLKTSDAVSKVVPAYQVALTLVLFGLIYLLLFIGWARVVLKVLREGPLLEGATGGTGSPVPVGGVSPSGTPAAVMSEANR
jgi:cytochrome d ubiquinol oxidase subunit I